MKPNVGAVGNSGCGGEGNDERDRQSTIRGRCEPAMGEHIGGNSVEIRDYDELVSVIDGVWYIRGVEGRCRKEWGLHYLFRLFFIIRRLCAFPHTHTQYTVY